MAKKPEGDVLDQIISEIEKTAKTNPEFEKKVTEITKNADLNPQKKVSVIRNVVASDDKFKDFSNLMEKAYKATEQSLRFENNKKFFDNKPKEISSENPGRLASGQEMEYRKTKDGEAEFKALKTSLNEMKIERHKILDSQIVKDIKNLKTEISRAVSNRAANISDDLHTLKTDVKTNTDLKSHLETARKAAGTVKKHVAGIVNDDAKNIKSAAGLIGTELKIQAKSIGAKLKSDLAARAENLGKQVNKAVGKDKEKASGQSR